MVTQEHSAEALRTLGDSIRTFDSVKSGRQEDCVP
jgi:hypothetical protein